MEEWQLFRIFQALGPAEAMRSWLEFEGVPCKVESRSLERAVETDFGLYVQKDLAHRARWIVAQARPTDSELEFLATGQLPNGPEK